jgi:LAS superfamily LD-carboxypeptidase LdcB
MIHHLAALIHRTSNTTLLIFGIVAGFVVVGNLVAQDVLLRQDLATLKEEVASTTAALAAQQSVDREEIELAYIALTETLEASTADLGNLSESVDRYRRDARDLEESVETLEKIATTDEQLLQKYSKVYFLNEHYIPEDLTIIDETYDFPNGKEVSVHARVWQFLEDLLEDARDDDIDIFVLSGYRSYAEQTTLKGNYLQTYGTGANAFSADQGYSEHQLGTTVDFTTQSLNGGMDGFETTEAFEWLTRNAYKYGFVMSYPENNQYYQYEPWHWRFVGKDLARHLDRRERHFYDMDQREIDAYLPNLFDR